MSSDVAFPPPDLSGYMTTAGAQAVIDTMNGRIDSDEARLLAVEAKKGLTLLHATTVGETTLLSVALGVKRYSVTIPAAPGVTTSDRIVVALTGSPTNGTVQDAFVSAANTVSVGVLVPAVGIGATVAVPVAIYKVV
jgi:hypothetical protein